MKLAFYYHIPILAIGNQLRCPSFLGVFLDELANQTDQLYLIMHTKSEDLNGSADYRLNAKNITLISLGKKTPLWHRSLFSQKILKQRLLEIECCDAIIVRAPSPLAPHFNKFLKHPKLYYMVVGDYEEGAKQIGKKGIKALLLSRYFLFADRQLRKQFPSTNIFVNSPQLYEKYKTEAKSIELVKTTTLLESDYYEKKDLRLQEPVQLLFTGRIDFAKGLKELVSATGELIQEGHNLHLNIVGWEENSQKNTEHALKKLAENYPVGNYVTFHGKKKLGSELNEMYRNASVYIIPSYYEGFPRTIWEAMANSCPVIASSVGAIPYYLKHEEHAYLIEPKSIEAIKEGILRIMFDENLRIKLIKNGFSLSKSVSLHEQTKHIIAIVNDEK